MVLLKQAKTAILAKESTQLAATQRLVNSAQGQYAIHLVASVVHHNALSHPPHKYVALLKITSAIQPKCALVIRLAALRTLLRRMVSDPPLFFVYYLSLDIR